MIIARIVGMSNLPSFIYNLLYQTATIKITKSSCNFNKETFCGFSCKTHSNMSSSEPPKKRRRLDAFQESSQDGQSQCEECKTCEGSGNQRILCRQCVNGWKEEDCNKCNNSGDCTRCNGNPNILLHSNNCTRCNGTGKYPR